MRIWHLVYCAVSGSLQRCASFPWVGKGQFSFIALSLCLRVNSCVRRQDRQRNRSVVTGALTNTTSSFETRARDTDGLEPAKPWMSTMMLSESFACRLGKA